MSWSPSRPEHDWATVKQFAHALVLQFEKANPALYLTKMSKARPHRQDLPRLTSATSAAPLP